MEALNFMTSEPRSLDSLSSPSSLFPFPEYGVMEVPFLGDRSKDHGGDAGTMFSTGRDVCGVRDN